MEEQKYILKNYSSFKSKDIFECGQCFRWNKNEDNTYTGIFKENVINIEEKQGKIIFKGICNGDIREIVREYFDLDRNYEEIKEKLSKIDNNLKVSVQYGQGIRILNQDLWETIMSFIISANNNIPRIKGIIERISSKYGKAIEYNGKTYYTFPTPEELKNVSIQEYRELGAGFRDKYLYQTVQDVLNEKIDLEKLHNYDTETVRKELLKLQGIGPKVADCILLFSTLKRLDVFPIDVWVRRVMNELYIKKENEESVNKKEINQLAEKKFGNIAGLAQQYLFYWKRETA